MVKLFRVKRTFSNKEKLNAIFTTFGSLSDFSCKHRSFQEAGKELGMKYHSLFNLIHRFKYKFAYNLDLFIANPKNTGRPRFRIVSTEIEKYLLSKECLSDWMHLTLK